MKIRLYRRLSLALAAFGLCFCLIAGPALAAADVDQMKDQIRVLQEQLEALKKRLDQTEKDQKKAAEEAQDTAEEVEELDERVAKNEIHTATDKLALSVEIRPQVESIHYSDVRFAPDAFVGGFFTDYPAGFNGATAAQAAAALQAMYRNGLIPDAEKRDASNDILWTTKFRLNMAAKLNNNLSFSGRMAAYKVWGDSTGVSFNNGRFADITLDGNTSSLPHGDTIHLERAYFVYSNQVGQVPIAFSFGRRPSTDGPPLEIGNYSLEGGSPLGTLINWQFDGASFSTNWEDVTGIPGAAFKLCYGLGFEGGYGNSYTLDQRADVNDVHMGGFIATLYDDGDTSAVLNFAHAQGITDGFTGLTVMPFIVSKEDRNGDGVPEYYFDKNDGGFISRMQPTTDIGNWTGLSAVYRTKWGGADFFFSANWSHTHATKISANPFYELMGMGLLSSNGQLEDRDGFMFYAGTRIPITLFGGHLGLEANYGSKYWLGFTGAEDNIVGSKLATRGLALESYYIQPIFGPNFFLKAGVQYIDYEYTGSGNPLGEPVPVASADAVSSLFPVTDRVLKFYLSLTGRF